MGCHTWFSVPYETDKEKIIKFAQLWLDNSIWVSDGHRKMYQYAIDNKLEEPICEIAAIENDCRSENWILYKGISDYSLEKYNKENNTEIQKYTKEASELNLESYSDEPRIGGYPDNIIHSYDEMVEFMKTGFINDEGKQFDFYYDKDRIQHILIEIKQFFINHPQGIITFG